MNLKDPKTLGDFLWIVFANYESHAIMRLQKTPSQALYGKV